jgi:hypothetical protein
VHRAGAPYFNPQIAEDVSIATAFRAGHVEIGRRV